MGRHGGSWISKNGKWYPNENIKNNGAYKTLKERNVSFLGGFDQQKVKQDLSVLNQPNPRNIVKSETKPEIQRKVTHA